MKISLKEVTDAYDKIGYKPTNKIYCNYTHCCPAIAILASEEPHLVGYMYTKYFDYSNEFKRRYGKKFTSGFLNGIDDTSPSETELKDNDFRQGFENGTYIRQGLGL